MPSNDPTNEQGQFIPSVLPTHPRNPMTDAKPLTPEVSARFEVDQYLFDCARPVVGHNFTDYEKHALLHRFVNLFKTIEALRARAEQAEKDRDALAEVVRRTDFAASLLSLAITHIPATNEIYKWAASGVDELRQARIDARAALARAGEVKP